MPDESHTHRVGSRLRERPAEHLDNSLARPPPYQKSTSSRL